MEKTLIILKPDAVQRGIIGDVLHRFEKVGLKIVGLKMVHPNEDHYHHHYETIGKVETRHGQDVYKRNTDFMMSGPVIAVVLEGIEAVSLVRKMVGDTEPKSAQPGTIRGDYAHVSYQHVNAKPDAALPNVIHASANETEAKQEVEHWFKADELFNYKTTHQHLTQ